jgi:ribosomal protein S12 methylthiotransferase
LRTSFVVGFPGETESDFRELCDFVRAAEFDWMGVFAYSDVDNAASHALEKKVEPETVAARRDHLMALQRRISARRLRRFVGKKLPALVEGPSKDGDFVWEARLEGMAPEIDGKVYLTDIQPLSGDGLARPGDLVTIEISESHEYDLIGRVIDIASSAPEPEAMNATPVQKISTGAQLRVLR